MDIEQERAPLTSVTNPYQPNNNNNTAAAKALVTLQRLMYLCVSLFGLYKLQFYRTIFVSSKIRHVPFQWGLAFTIAMFLIKAHVELYQGRLHRQTVNYQNFRQTTHLFLVLWTMASLCFFVALWPHYRWNSIVVLSLLAFGVVLQFLLLLPNTWAQNAIALVGMTFFLQEYAGFGAN